MGSPQKSSVYQRFKTKESGHMGEVSGYREPESINKSPHRGHGIQTSISVTMNPKSYRKPESLQPIAEYPQSQSAPSGFASSRALYSQGAEPKSNLDMNRPSSFYRRRRHDQTTDPQTAAQVPHPERPRREIRPEQDSSRPTFTPVTRSSRRLNFMNQKDNLEDIPEDPPSKVQYPQGVRGPRRSLVYPKDAEIQTDSNFETKARKYISRIAADFRAAHKRIPYKHCEVGVQTSFSSEPKTLHRCMNLESDLKLSVLKDVDCTHRVSPHPEPECHYKSSVKPSRRVLMSSEKQPNVRPPVQRDISSLKSDRLYRSRKSQTESTDEIPGRDLEDPCVCPELELTPRPLPPRSLPTYGPDSSWWALLNPGVEVPKSRPTLPQKDPKCPPAYHPCYGFYERDSSSCSEDHRFQRKKNTLSRPPTSPSPPPISRQKAPCQTQLRKSQQASNHSKQPIQRFSAFFLGM